MINWIADEIYWRLLCVQFDALENCGNYQAANNTLLAELGPDAQQLFIFQKRELAISINKLKADITMIFLDEIDRRSTPTGVGTTNLWCKP